MAGKKAAEFMIVNRRSGKALQATGLDNGLVVEQAEPAKTDAQTWTMVENENGVKLFNKACGKVLDVMQGGTSNGTWAQTWEDVDGASQLWKLISVTSTYKKIIHALSGKALDVVDMSDEDGAPAQIWDSVEGEGQQWKLVSTAPKAATKTVRKSSAKKAPEEQAPAKAEKPARRTRAAKAVAEEKSLKEEPAKALKKHEPAPKAMKKQEETPKTLKKHEPAPKAMKKQEESPKTLVSKAAGKPEKK